MRFGSVCSGIEAASVAWHPLGWRAAWLAEIEPFPSAVLKHHYPEVPNLGDMTTLPDRIRSGEIEAPDLFCGGTPCQAFSVAGLRRSLDDARGNLSLTFCEIADAIDSVRLAAGKPASIVFWENVPGVLSTADNAFGCFLAGLAGESEPLVPPGRKWEDAGCVLGPARTIAWRTLDAQYFGLAQRRRRVFVVASARDGFDPGAVLLEWEGLRRDTPPSREAGQGAPGSAETSFGVDLQNASLTGDASGTIQAEAQRTGNRGHGVLAFGGGQNCTQTDVSTSLSAHPGGSRLDFQTETFVAVAFADTAPTLSVGAHGAAGHPHRQHGNETAIIGMQPWKCPDCGNGMEFNHRGCRLFPVAFHPTQDPISSADGTTHAMGRGSTKGVATVAVLAEHYTHDYCHDRVYSVDGLSPALNTAQHHNIRTAMQVRRLTPVECERLQGFPDNYTAIPWRKKPADECPDGPRYKALGNSWAVPVVRWIGRRINERIGNE
jgi:DNA (cytosine-5)-methyltransferase 1